MAYVVIAHRGAGSLFGAGRAPVKALDGRVMRWETLDAARTQAAVLNAQTRSVNVHYAAAPECAS